MRYLVFIMVFIQCALVFPNTVQLVENFNELKESVLTVNSIMRPLVEESDDPALKSAWSEFKGALGEITGIRSASDASRVVKKLSSKAKELQKIVERTVDDEKKNELTEALSNIQSSSKQLYLLTKNLREDGDVQIANLARGFAGVSEIEENIRETGNLLRNLRDNLRNLKDDVKNRDTDNIRNTGENISDNARRIADTGRETIDQARRIFEGARNDYQRILDEINGNNTRNDPETVLTGVNNRTLTGEEETDDPGVNAVKLLNPSDKAILEDKNITFKWESYGENLIYEITLWEKSNDRPVVFNTTDGTEWKPALNQYGDVVEFLWSVRARKTSGEQVTEYGAKNSFSFKEMPYEMPDGKIDWKKTGETLVIPVEFTDSKFEGSYSEKIKTKVDEMLDVYKKMSFNEKKTMEELKYDIAPLIKLEKTLAHYGKDVPSEKANVHGLNYMTDAGEYKKQYGGQHALKKHAMEYLMKWRIPVNRYNHLLYLVPGAGGNNNPNDKLWPCSNSANPNLMARIPFTDKAVGLTMGGILMGVDTNVGTYIHEFGHQLGLPDLYPYQTTHPNRNAGISALMGSGTGNPGNGCTMMGLSRKKGYLGYRVKGNWMKDRIKEINEGGSFDLYSRDSDKSPLILIVNIKSTWDPDDCIVVEVFDKNRLDKNLRMSVEIDGSVRSPKAGVLIYHSDDDDVEEIKSIYALPKESSTTRKAFIAGGVAEIEGVKITVEEINEESDLYKAKIKVEYVNSKKPGGFVNTVKGVGSWIWNKLRDVL